VPSENDTVEVGMYEGKPVTLNLSPSVELEVVETEPGLKNATVTNVQKPATLETEPPGGVRVRLAEPEAGIAPGQACVFYDADRVLGGGWIRRRPEGA